VPYRVVEYAQKVYGAGGSIVQRTYQRAAVDGGAGKKTFKGNERLDNADVSHQTVQYLYSDILKFYFMNPDSFEQFDCQPRLLVNRLGYMKEVIACQAQQLMAGD